MPSHMVQHAWIENFLPNVSPNLVEFLIMIVFTFTSKEHKLENFEKGMNSFPVSHATSNK